VKLLLTHGLTTATTNDHKEVTMKKVTLFATTILALAMCASADDKIDFTHLSPSTTPQAIAYGYNNMVWTGIDYVSAERYEKWLVSNGYPEGDGFTTGPEAQVALIGGPLCYQKYGGATTTDVCRGSITSAVAAEGTFRPHYIIGSEGWIQDGHQFVTVEAYLNGNKIGSQRFDLGVDAKKFQLVLPNSWGQVSELVLWPSPGGSFVLYVLDMN
jgi:hypothetical protein